MTGRLVGCVALALVALAAVTPATAGPRPKTLIGTVGTMGNPNAFEIGLTLDGKPVKKIPPGTYVVRIVDKSAIHNFHLLRGKASVKGTNVATKKSGNVASTVPAKTGASFRVKLTKGTYTFLCDPHASSMKGTFKVS